jgi:hypothetical protein
MSHPIYQVVREIEITQDVSLVDKLLAEGWVVVHAYSPVLSPSWFMVGRPSSGCAGLHERPR